MEKGVQTIGERMAGKEKLAEKLKEEKKEKKKGKKEKNKEEERREQREEGEKEKGVDHKGSGGSAKRSWPDGKGHGERERSGLFNRNGSADINRAGGEWYKMEQSWAEALESERKVN